MKSKHLLTALLGSTLIFAACGNNAAEKTEDKAKTEETKTTESTAKQTAEKSTTEKSTTEDKATSTGEVKSATDLIAKAKEAEESIKSYHADYSSSMDSDGSKNSIEVDLISDDKDRKKIKNTNHQKQTNFFVFDDKVIANQDEKDYIDVSKVMGKEVIKQLEQIAYNPYIKSLDYFKNATFKKTDDGYSLTLTYKNLEEYKEIAKQTGSEELVKSIEKQLKNIKGTETVNFNKDYLVKSAKRDVEMKIKDKSIKSVTNINYDKFNEVDDIKIPDGVKNAKSYEDFQKEMQQKLQKDSSNESKSSTAK